MTEMRAETEAAKGAESAVEARLRLVLEATGDGLWDWDLRTGQTWLSPGYWALTGSRPESVKADLAFFESLVHPEDWQRALATMDAHLRGETKESVIEYRMVTASGALRWMLGRGKVVERDADGAPLRMIGLISDVSEKRRLEEERDRALAESRAVVQDQTELISRFDADGTLLFVNEAACRLFRTAAEDMIGRRWQPNVFPEDVSGIEAALTGLSPGNPVAVIENRVYAGDGSLRWMQFINRALYDANGRLSAIQSVGRDISARKALEAEREKLYAENRRMGLELIRIQERERAALARELHDELSQEIAAIRSYAGAIVRRGQGDGQTAADAEAIAASASRIYDVSHRLMEGLHPQVLDSGGLAMGLGSLLATWSKRNPAARVWLRLHGPLPTLGEEASIHLYRIVQECLANVAQHAHARRVRLFLGMVGGAGKPCLRLTARDDGSGLDMAQPMPGFGLIVMRERARLLGGEITFQSAPGRGLRLSVTLPVALP